MKLKIWFIFLSNIVINYFNTQKTIWYNFSYRCINQLITQYTLSIYQNSMELLIHLIQINRIMLCIHKLCCKMKFDGIIIHFSSLQFVGFSSLFKSFHVLSHNNVLTFSFSNQSWYSSKLWFFKTFNFNKGEMKLIPLAVFDFVGSSKAGSRSYGNKLRWNPLCRNPSLKPNFTKGIIDQRKEMNPIWGTKSSLFVTRQWWILPMSASSSTALAKSRWPGWGDAKVVNLIGVVNLSLAANANAWRVARAPPLISKKCH